MARLRILTLIAVVLAGIVFALKNKKPDTIAAGKGLVMDKTWLTINPHPATPQKDVRPTDQTFLTYPEWFLVFSPKEQADYFEQHTSTSFPYTNHIDQLWNGYGVVYDQIKGNYKFNTGYHIMIMVIGVSTTVEYGIKSFYETTIGRVTDNTHMTEEDKFNARYMRSYVNFIEATPWYDYNFNAQLSDLWSTTDFFGPHFLRKMERKYYLTTELLVKSGYGWLIKQGTKSAYDEALLNTAVITDGFPAKMTEYPEVKDLIQLSSDSVMMNLPRYADFNPAVCKLALLGVNFKEIAGNNGAIMLTVLSTKPMAPAKDLKVIFTQPIVTKPGLNRIAIVTTVKNLSPVLRELLGKKATIEHVYDY
ncbi:hypothetical protein [Mucilaginibacter sp.]|uniref:hypothetical protein n=1 Tax=Mucilaginibacter sp. TaxID=1882438 RepID=UPI0032634B59